jgi:rRNA processing protein Gar1
MLEYHIHACSLTVIKLTNDFSITKAGHIKCHLVSERTIVVESDNNNDNSNRYPITSNDNNLLDEGSLLLLKVSTGEIIDNVNKYKWMAQVSSSASSQSFSDNKGDHGGEENAIVIPLGKILEVFGPISKPLYTVRLLLSQVREKVQVQEKKEENNQDCNLQNEDMAENTQTKSTTSANEKDKNEEQCDVDKVDNERNREMEKEQILPLGTPDAAKTNEASIDPWTDNGVLTDWIRSKGISMEVYYATNQVKFVDTQSVVRNSRKGCGK